MDVQYALLRESDRALKYRLKRRGLEVVRALRKYGGPLKSILDMGTAEGRMMQMVKAEFPGALCVGVDLSLPLLRHSRERAAALGIQLLQADIQDLGFFRDASFSAAIAMAVIEHLEDPRRFLAHAFRLLEGGGVLVISTPHPFWDRLAGRLHLVQGEHKSVMRLRELRKSCQAVGFRVIEEKGFMISPVGFQGERTLEKFLGFFKLDRGLANQLIVLRKPSGIAAERVP